MTRVGLVGCGRWGRYILRDLKALGCDVTVVARSHSSRSFAHQYGASRIVGSIQDLPADLAGYVVATPTSLHAKTVEPLLARARPIFVEKPLTNDPASARALAAKGHNLIFVMDKWRYHPGVEALRDLAGSGELGPLESIRTTRIGWGNPHLDVDATWILMPHDLSIVLEILGYIPDPVFAVAEYGNSELTGLLGILGGSPRVLMEVSARRVSRIRSVSLNFRDGAALLHDAYAAAIEIRRVAGREARESDPCQKRALPGEMPLLKELRSFVEYLEGGPPPRSTAAEGARVVEVIAWLLRLAHGQIAQRNP